VTGEQPKRIVSKHESEKPVLGFWFGGGFVIGAPSQGYICNMPPCHVGVYATLTEPSGRATITTLLHFFEVIFGAVVSAP